MRKTTDDMKNYSRIFRAFLLGILGIVLAGCNKPAEKPEPDPTPVVNPDAKETVITGDATSVSAFSATLSGTVNVTGGMQGVRFGVLVSEKEDAARDESLDLESKELGSKNQFKVTTDRLKPDTRYFFKAYLLSDGIYRYGDVKSFKTASFEISVITQKETEVSSQTVTFHGKYLVDKEFSSALEVGFRYAPSEEELTSGKDRYVKGEKGQEGVFSKTVEGLKPATTYYFRACAAYNDWEVFGEIRSFTTEGGQEPTPQEAVITLDVTEVNAFGVTLNGEAHPTTEMGGIQLGFLVSDQPEPSLGNAMDYSTQELDKEDRFKVQIDGLWPETRYYYKAYILYGGLYRYGETKSFETSAALSVTTGDATDITYATARLSGSFSILDELPSSPGVVVGFLYSIFAESLTDDLLDGDDRPSDFHAILCDQQADGSFSGTADGLTPNSTYYYRAIAIFDDQSYGAFGEVRTFKSAEKPGLQEVADWSIRYDGRTALTQSDGSVATVESFSFKYTGDNYFFVRTVTSEEINKQYNGDIKAYFEGQAGYLASQARSLQVPLSELTGVFDKSTRSTWYDLLIHDKYTAYMIEVTADGTATGRYAKSPCIVVEETPTNSFRRWLGRWRITDGSATFYVDISSCEANYLYYVNGWETGSGVSVQMNGSDDWFFARFRKEDGMIVFYGQDVASYYDSAGARSSDKVFAGGYSYNGEYCIDVEGVDNWYDIAHSEIKYDTFTLVPESFTFDDGSVVTYETMQYFEYVYSSRNWYTYNSRGIPIFTGQTVQMNGVAANAPMPFKAAAPRELARSRGLHVHQDRQAGRSGKGRRSISE